MSTTLRGLWSRPTFLQLWAGQAASLFGSRIGGFAYDLTAILVLHASPAQMAILNGCLYAPPLLAAPAAGIWADRIRRRPLLIAADLGRALAMTGVPAAAVAHSLTIFQLYLVAALVSTLGAVFDVSYRAYVPALIGPERVAEANSIFSGTAAVAETGGWGVAGVLVQLFTAPIVIAADAISFLISALSLAGLPTEPRVVSSPRRAGWWREMRDGLRVVRNDGVLRALALAGFVGEMMGNVIGVVIILFFVRDLHLPPVALGPLIGIGGISSLAGSIVARRVARRLGVGRTLIAAGYLDTLGLLPLVLAAGPLPLVSGLVALGQLTDIGGAISEIHSLSVIQRRAPDVVAGRVNAVFETLTALGMTAGLLAGGVLGSAVGLRNTLILAMAGELLVPLFLVFSPVARLDGE